MQEKVVAIIGGGRWARVYLSVLTTFDLPYRLVVVSTANAKQFAGLRDRNNAEIRVVPTVEQLLQVHPIAFAVVVNAARLHAATAIRLLEARVPVLMEKPLALCRTDIERLNSAALHHGVHLMPAFTFLNCSYLHHFAQTVDALGERLAGVRLEWSDPRAEVRYGEEKGYDPGISVAQDVMPHIGAILSLILKAPDVAPNVLGCRIERGGRKVTLDLTYSGAPCRVILEREAEARRRLLAVELESGIEPCLDFTTEPGVITVGSRSMSGDPDWNDTVKPVRRLLQSFLSMLALPLPEPLVDEHLRRVGVSTVALAEECDAALKAQQRLWLSRCSKSQASDDITYAISELGAPKWFDAAQIAPGDPAALRQRTRVEMQRIMMSGGEESWLSALEAPIAFQNQDGI